MMQGNAETGRISIGLADNAGRAEPPTAAMPLSLAPRVIFSAVSAMALAAGIWAAGAMDYSSEAWLAVLIGLVLTQIVWNTLWATIAETPWNKVLHAGRQWQAGVALRQLPYTQPGSAAAQASVRLGQWRDWAAQLFWPHYGVLLASTAGAILIGLVLALVLGPQPAALTLAAVCVPQVAALHARGSGQPGQIARGLVMAGLPLLLGYALFAPLSIDIAIAGLGSAIVFGATGQTRHARLFWIIGSAILIGLMIATRRPLGAFALGVLALPQMLLTPSRFLKGWIMAMLLAVGVAIS